MRRYVMAALLVAGSASAHDLTDPTVRGHSTSIEAQVHRDRALLDVWIQMNDLAAIQWRREADINKDGALTDEEIERTLNTDLKVFVNYGIGIEVAEAGQSRKGLHLAFEKKSADTSGSKGITLERVKLNFQLRLCVHEGEGASEPPDPLEPPLPGSEWKPQPGTPYRLTVTYTNPFDPTRLRARVIREGNTAIGLIDDDIFPLAKVMEGFDAPTAKGGFIWNFDLTVPKALENAGRFFTPDGREVDMNSGQFLAVVEPKHGLEGLGDSFDQKLRAFLMKGDRPPVALIVLMLGVAFAYGAAHAVGPGHGKSLVAAYLVGSHGRIGHAVLLGIVVTVSHVGVVVALGLALWIWKVDDVAVKNWISLASGVTIILMGAWLFYSRLRYGLGHSHGPGGHTHLPGEAHHHHDHEHAHAHDHAHAHAHGHAHGHDHGHGHHHDHGHDHDHSHEHEHDHVETLQPLNEAPNIRAWDLITTGVLGGMVPCPAALVILLLSLGVNRPGWGLLLIAAFSLGLGGVLTIIGVLLLLAKKFMAKKMEGSSKYLRFAAVASSVVITVIGTVLTIQAVKAMMA